MAENEQQSDDPKKYEIELKLYALLVDQLLKYHATIWQIPTALVIGNFLAIEKFLTEPILLAALAIFNFGLIFVLHRMIKNQIPIIDATVKAEDKLRSDFGDFLPTFHKHKWRAPFVFVSILFLLEAGLVVYILVLFCSPGQDTVLDRPMRIYQHKHSYHRTRSDSCAAHNKQDKTVGK